MRNAAQQNAKIILSVIASCVNRQPYIFEKKSAESASIAQLVEHALRKRMVLGSIPSGGFVQLSAHAAMEIVSMKSQSCFADSSMREQVRKAAIRYR